MIKRDLVCFQTWKNFRNGRERSKKDYGRYSLESEGEREWVSEGERGAWLHFDYDRFWKRVAERWNREEEVDGKEEERRAEEKGGKKNLARNEVDGRNGSEKRGDKRISCVGLSFHKKMDSINFWRWDLRERGLKGWEKRGKREQRERERKREKEMGEEAIKVFWIWGGNEKEECITQIEEVRWIQSSPKRDRKKATETKNYWRYTEREREENWMKRKEKDNFGNK